MKAIIPTIFAVWAGITSAAAIDTKSAELAAPPHPVGRLGWYGAVVEGGPAVYYEGDDLNDIDSQINTDHPHLSLFDGTMSFSDNGTAVGVPDGASFITSEVVRLDERALEARDDTYRTECEKPWGGIALWDLNTGVSYLKTVSRCVVQARQCIRLTCNGNSAAVFCNDNTYALDMACSHLANMIQDAVANCFFTIIEAIFQPSVQRFNENQRYNVITSMCPLFSPSGQPV